MPQITIKPDVSPQKFIKRVHDLLDNADLFNRELHEKCLGEKDYYRFLLNIHPLWDLGYEGLLGQMIYHQKNDIKIRVEISAKRWGISPPEYEDFVSVAKQIFVPILKKYNKIYGVKLRMNIESSKSLEPKISPEVRKFLDNFIELSNKNELHPFDWKRFYKFIHAAHTFRSKLSEEDLSDILLKSGFKEDYAEEIASIYSHGRALLSLKRIWDIL